VNKTEKNGVPNK